MSQITEKLSGHTILVMDDEADIRILFTLNLERLGCQVIPTCNPDETLIIYQRSLEEGTPIDAIILDLNIPGNIGGEEVAARIRALNTNAKIIVSSGDTTGAEMTDYKKHGFDAALEKTFDRNKMQRVLEKVLLD